MQHPHRQLVQNQKGFELNDCNTQFEKNNKSINYHGASNILISYKNKNLVIGLALNKSDDIIFYAA